MQNGIAGSLIAHMWQEFQAQVAYQPSLLGEQPVLDHFAIIDLPYKTGGIEYLEKFWQRLGFKQTTRDYIPEKYNDFIGMTHESNYNSKVHEALPQVVLADFRLHEMSSANQKIMHHYLNNATINEDPQYNVTALNKFFSCRNWPLPTKKHYLSIMEENPLIAWVLVFGRKINHFALGVHCAAKFSSLHNFNRTMSRYYAINDNEGEIKGKKESGIEQAASMGASREIQLEGGSVILNDVFLEFVWRHSIKAEPQLWPDYFTGFIGKNATHIIESLYNN